jgi:hypothetical protein
MTFRNQVPVLPYLLPPLWVRQNLPDFDDRR